MFKESSYEIHYQKMIGITKMNENSEELERREDEYKLSKH